MFGTTQSVLRRPGEQSLPCRPKSLVELHPAVSRRGRGILILFLREESKIYVRLSSGYIFTPNVVELLYIPLYPLCGT